MASLIKGISVTLYQRRPVGTDAFMAPVYEETPVQVDNVLVSPASGTDVVDTLQLYGKRAEYQLCIPKGDDHQWKGCRVDFFGRSWRVFGPVEEYIESMVPLDWNKKVRVERYE